MTKRKYTTEEKIAYFERRARELKDTNTRFVEQEMKESVHERADRLEMVVKGLVHEIRYLEAVLKRQGLWVRVDLDNPYKKIKPGSGMDTEGERE